MTDKAIKKSFGYLSGLNDFLLPLCKDKEDQP